VVFADNATKYDRRSRKQRRVILVSEQAMYIIAIEKNKDKDKIQRKKKPFVYMLKRRIDIKKVNSVTLSTHADNFVIFIVPGEHDNLIECRRKTELIAAIKKINPGLSSTITDTYVVIWLCDAL
jgi:myosin I